MIVTWHVSMVAYIRHLVFDLKSKLLFYFDLFSFQNHFWFHFDFNIQFHSNLFSFQNHFHHGIFPPNTIFLICFIYFFILKPFSLWHISAKCKFILKRNAFNFILISPRGIYPPFSVYSVVAWRISANGEPPLSIETSACLRQSGTFITLGYTLFALKDAILNRFQFSWYRRVVWGSSQTFVKFQTISIKIDRESEECVTERDFVK